MADLLKGLDLPPLKMSEAFLALRVLMAESGLLKADGTVNEQVVHATIHRIGRDWESGHRDDGDASVALSPTDQAGDAVLRKWAVETILGGERISHHGLYVQEVTANADKLVKWVLTGEPIDV